MKKLFLLLAIPVALSFTGCKKQGCVDPIATNYSDAAKKDDGSCLYETKLIFWYDSLTSASWMDNNINSVYFYIDNEIEYVSSAPTNQWWSEEPSCNVFGIAPWTTVLTHKNESKTIHIYIKDELGNILNDNIVTINDGICNYYNP